MSSIRIGGHEVGHGQRPYILAEIGSNHNGDLDLCYELIDEAARCGAHGVKFQSWSSTSLVSKAEYSRNTTYEDTKKHFGSLKEMVEAYQFTPEMHRLAAARCKERGVTFMSTPFSPEEVGLLEEVGVEAYKVASMDVNHPVLLRTIAETGKPVILSTGMATLGEIETAIQVLRGSGAGPVMLLHCVSIYPPHPDEIDLLNIPMLRQAFDVPIGFSDHTLGLAIPLAAVALGACMIEKHFTLDKDKEGWDHAISADPAELSTLVVDSGLIHRGLGSSVRRVSEAEMQKREKFRRRIVLRKPVASGTVLRLEDLDFKRPGNGIHPDQFELVVGKRALSDLPADHELEWADLG